MTSSRRMKTRLTASTLGVLGAAAIVASVGVTASAYVDSTYARTESLSVQAVAPFQPGLARNSRMVDTGIALGNNGNVYVWGLTGLAINGGAGNPGGQRAPQQVPLPSGQIKQIASGIYNANALTADGTVYGWGLYPQRDGTDAAKPNDNPRQLRIGTAWTGTGPILDQILSISSTETAGAGIRADGSIWNWGEPVGYGGNSGPGASKVAGLPDPSIAGNRPIYLKGAYTNFFTILENGDVYYWGGAGSNSLPPGTAQSTNAALVTALSPWMKKNVASGAPYITAVDGGIGMGAATLSNGNVLSWGSSALRTGRGLPTSPAVILSLSNISSMQFGYTGATFITPDGTLWGYGASDDYGQLPVLPVVVDTNVSQFAVGQGYYLWQRQNGTYWGRGYNPQGAIGLPVGTQTVNRQISWDLSFASR